MTQVITTVHTDVVLVLLALVCATCLARWVACFLRDRQVLVAVLERLAGGEAGWHEVQVGTGVMKPLALACNRLVPQARATLAQLERVSRYDALTGLPNGSAFKRAAQAHIASAPEAGALLALGINELRKVNESFGHSGGDQLLCAVADRLRLLLGGDEAVAGRAEPVLGRLYGDEFGVFLPGVVDRCEVERFVHRLQRAIGETLHIGETSLKVRPSIGAVLVTGCDGQFDSLFAAADAARCHARDERGEEAGPDDSGGFAFYTPQLRRAADQMLERELDLRNALENGEFCLHYQPQLNLKTGRVESVEALIRWNHPTRGLVYPGDFVPFVESSGLIDDMGDWVMAEAIRAAARWRAQGHELRVSINVSPKQLYRVELIPLIRACLARFGLPARLLEIEITEAAIMRHEDVSLERIQGLRRDGVAVAIDDFGTGYSNLAQLMSLAMDRLKLDRSLIKRIATDRRQQLVVGGIISVAGQLGCEIVAEGVEDTRQLGLLKLAGCDYVQGYAVAYPVPEAELFAVLDELHAADLGDFPERLSA